MIPEGWRATTIDEICEFRRGLSWKKHQERKSSGEGRTAVLRIPNVQQGLDLSDLLYLEGVHPEEIARTRISRGWCVLVGSNGNARRVGNAALVEGDADFVFASFLVGVGPRDHGRLDPRFLFRLLQSESVQQDISENVQGTTGLKNLNLRALKSLRVSLPSLGEQRKIAAILSSVDAAIEATQAVIDQLQVVKKAMMAELLTRGLPGRHTRFKKTELGEVPDEWQLVSLSDLLAEGPTNGIYKPAHLIGRGVLIAGMTAIDGSTLRWDACRRAELEPAEVERFGVRHKDILITRVYARIDGVGRFILVPEPDEAAVYESNMMRIRVDPGRVVPEFVALHMQLPQIRKQIEQRATLGAQASINSSGIRSLPLRLPRIEEQYRIVSVLSSVDERLDREREHLKQSIASKSALQSALLTGEIRVTPDPEEPAP